MTKKQWPSFCTGDLGDTDEDDAEMHRRWEVYNREMQALIAAGGVHQDADGWWIDDATGELIGPDPSIEEPLSSERLARMRPFREVSPDLAGAIEQEIAKRGRPRMENPRQAVTLRLDPDTLRRFQAKGKDWRKLMSKMLDEAKP